MPYRSVFLAACVSVSFITAPALAHDPVVTAHPDQAVDEVPLHLDLGDLSHPIDTGNDRAQAYFDQGLRLTWAFNHAEAAARRFRRTSIRALQGIDFARL